MKTSNKLATVDPEKTIRRLWERLDKTPKGKAHSKNLAEFRRIVKENPEALPPDWRAGPGAAIALIDKISTGGSRACLIADYDLTRKEFEYDTAPALERVLIDSILSARLRHMAIEHGYACAGFADTDRWETLLANAQNRLLRAVESLARVRRLSRNAPTIQLNVAGNGGQQVNAVGFEPTRV